MRGVHAGSHEQHHVLVPGLPVVHHLLLEELEMILVVAVDLQQPDGHLPVPLALVDLAPAALADGVPQLDLLKGDVPLLQVHAGLAGFAVDHPLQVRPPVGQIFHLILIVLGL